MNKNDNNFYPDVKEKIVQLIMKSLPIEDGVNFKLKGDLKRLLDSIEVNEKIIEDHQKSFQRVFFANHLYEYADMYQVCPIHHFMEVMPTEAYDSYALKSFCIFDHIKDGLLNHVKFRQLNFKPSSVVIQPAFMKHAETEKNPVKAMGIIPVDGIPYIPGFEPMKEPEPSDNTNSVTIMVNGKMVDLGGQQGSGSDSDNSKPGDIPGMGEHKRHYYESIIKFFREKEMEIGLLYVANQINETRFAHEVRELLKDLVVLTKTFDTHFKLKEPTEEEKEKQKGLIKLLSVYNNFKESRPDSEAFLNSSKVSNEAIKKMFRYISELKHLSPMTEDELLLKLQKDFLDFQNKTNQKIANLVVSQSHENIVHIRMHVRNKLNPPPKKEKPAGFFSRIAKW